MGMTAQQFMSTHRASASRVRGKRKSAMVPYAAQLQQLREKGYTLAQCRDFLKANEVEVNVPAISTFLTNLRKASEPATTGR